MKNNEKDYGLCESSLVGRHLVDSGLADTRAIAIANALKDLWGAVCGCDDHNLHTLIKNERWIVEAANMFAWLEIESTNSVFKNRTFDEEMETFDAWVRGLVHANRKQLDWQDEMRIKSMRDYETVKRQEQK